MTQNDNSDEMKAKRREIALLNLNSKSLTNLAIAQAVESAGNKFGDAGKAAYEGTFYTPTINSVPEAYDLETGQKSNPVADMLTSGRIRGLRYTGGSRGEAGVIESCMKVYQQSLLAVKVEDVLKLTGSEKCTLEKYRGKYVHELSEDEQRAVITFYIESVAIKKVSEALGESSKSVKGGLEKLLTEEPPEELAEAA